MFRYDLRYSVSRRFLMKKVEFSIYSRKLDRVESTFYGDAFYDFSKDDIGTMDFRLFSMSFRSKANPLIFC